MKPLLLPRRRIIAGLIITAPCIAIFLFLASLPGFAADRVPCIQSIIHSRLDNGDSLLLTSDDPLPQAAVNGSSGSIEIEFKGLNCKLPSGTKNKFATKINGKLIERMDIRVDGAPPRSYFKLSITPGADYEYAIFEPAPNKLEIQVLYPKPITRASQPPKFVPPPPLVIEPSARDAEPVSKITSVKYYRLGIDSDRIVFAFDSEISNPDVKFLDFPPRLELTFASTGVQLPATAVNGAFVTGISGHLIDKMKIQNPLEPSDACDIGFNTIAGSGVAWKISSNENGKLTLDIHPQAGKPERDRIIKSLRKDDEVASKPETHAEAIALPKLKLEVDWPANKNMILDKISIAAASLAPGDVAQLPIDLKLYIPPTGDGAPYPGLQN